MFKDVCEDLVSFDLKNKKWNLDIKEWRELIARMVHRTIHSTTSKTSDNLNSHFDAIFLRDNGF